MLPHGVNYDNLELISVDHARNLLDARKSEVTTGLKCWIAGGQQVAHEYGYKAINLANTYSLVKGKERTKIDIKKMYLHHLALIAAERLDELRWCSQANNRFQVSHLCHNNGCFDPRHLIVEEADRNKARNSCQGHEIIEYSGVGPMRYNPCPHGGERKMYRKCLLPTRAISEPGNYENEA